jgi:Type I phosphodiesterase / nucleotide pyrophosphatase
MSRSTRARIAILVVVLAGGSVSILRSHRPAPGIERVVLLGFDGVAPNLMEPLLAQGKLPAVRRLMAEGTYGPLQSFHPCKSGVLWTSIATGKTMLKHGILDWTYINDNGIALPYEDTGRRVKTYWEILAEKGVKTGTLNWWVSYPPPPIPGGFLVSNAFRKRPDPDTVSPPSLFDWIDPVRLPYAEVPEEMKREAFPVWKEEDATVPLGAARSVLESYATYFGQDVTVDRASDYLWTHQPVQVFSTYFRLPDVTSHFAGHFVDRALYDEVTALDQQGKLTPEALARLDADMARVVAPAYERMDRAIAKYLDRIDDRTLLIVCSDHGFAFFHGGYNHYNPAMPPPDGVLFLRGPGIRKGGRLVGPRLYDIAPTVLHAMGQPTAEDMDGTVLRAAYEPSYLDRHPVRTIQTYEGTARPTGAGASHKTDEEVLDDLRTLGYIDAGKGVPSPSPTTR